MDRITHQNVIAQREQLVWPVVRDVVPIAPVMELQMPLGRLACQLLHSRALLQRPLVQSKVAPALANV